MNVRITYETQFPAAIYFDGTPLMTHFNIKLWMTTHTESSETHTIAYERVKYFIQNRLHSCVFIHDEDIETIANYQQCGFNVVTLPGEPVEQLVGIMLYYKLNSIMEGKISIEQTAITSGFSEGITYLHDNDEKVNLTGFPLWWESSDLTTFDEFDDSESENEIKIVAFSSGWKDVQLQWPVDDDEDGGNTVPFLNKDED